MYFTRIGVFLKRRELRSTRDGLDPTRMGQTHTKRTNLKAMQIV